MRADVGGRGTAHRDDLLALLSSSGLSITGSASSTSVEMLRQALASSDETVTLQQFMAQIRDLIHRRLRQQEHAIQTVTAGERAHNTTGDRLAKNEISDSE